MAMTDSPRICVPPAPPKEPKGQVTMWLSDAVVAAVDKVAAETNRNRSQVVDLVLREALMPEQKKAA
jgi:predicted transcriptional regulator